MLCRALTTWLAEGVLEALEVLHGVVARRFRFQLFRTTSLWVPTVRNTRLQHKAVILGRLQHAHVLPVGKYRSQIHEKCGYIAHQLVVLAPQSCSLRLMLNLRAEIGGASPNFSMRFHHPTAAYDLSIIFLHVFSAVKYHRPRRVQ